MTNKKSKGAVSGIFLVLGIILLVVIVIVFVVIQINATKTANKDKEKENQITQPVGPKYSTQLGDVKFVVVSAIDAGKVIKSKNPAYTPDMVTTERFVKVTVNAQDKGKNNLAKDTWALGNIVDSEGRNFIPINSFNQSYYVLDQNVLTCGSLLKPEFEPTPCTRYYEVSKASTGLKIAVNIANENSAKVLKEEFLDLNIR